jgi:hypothetical protein
MIGGLFISGRAVDVVCRRTEQMTLYLGAPSKRKRANCPSVSTPSAVVEMYRDSTFTIVPKLELALI